jgi:hypothetical protein
MAVIVPSLVLIVTVKVVAGATVGLSVKVSPLTEATVPELVLVPKEDVIFNT